MNSAETLMEEAQPQQIPNDFLGEVYFQPPVLWLARLFLLAAISTAAYLATVSFKGGAVAGCGPGSGCDRALSSHWAYWFGLPVSVPALVIYFCLLTASITVGSAMSRSRRVSLHFIFAFSLLILAAAAWFILIQKLLLHSWCKICLATHANAGLAAALLLGSIVTNPAKSISLRRTIRLSLGFAIAGVALLMAGQILVKQKLYAVSQLRSRTAGPSLQILLHDGQFRLDPNELPIFGSVAATNFIVSFFDYTCSHCRALHSLLKEAEIKYHGQLEIISLPVPLDAQCNPLIIFTAPVNQGACEYAKIGLAVWRVNQAAFSQFDDWIFASAEVPTLDLVRNYAEVLVGKEALNTAMNSAWVARQLQTDMAIYQANSQLIGDGRLPQLVVGDVIAHGAIQNQSELSALIEKHLAILIRSNLGLPKPAR